MKMSSAIFMVAVIISITKSILSEPVLVSNITIDYSKYDESSGSYYAVPDPFEKKEIAYGGSGRVTEIHTYFFAYKVKNSNQFDIYSFTGKCGTANIPAHEINYNVKSIFFSSKIIDEDDKWEALVNYYEDQSAFFKIFDDDGSVILSDSGLAFLGCDGSNTYVVIGHWVPNGILSKIKTWRFRSNIINSSAQPLAKTKSSQVLPMQIYGGTGGDYRITLSPSNGNQMNFQMFDLTGRCVFSKKIDNLTSPVTFTVPAGDVPNSPFIAKVNDGNGSFYKKGITVK